ncbi:MAG TPA: YtxH domain-containing protein [Nitrospirota bacterium]|nr:YtxH domain-containing protein [Nitrospirota bacterium]
MFKIFNTRKRSVLIPALAGGITGAGLALLVAPKPGKALRKDLKRLARNTQDQVSEAIYTGKELYGDGKAAVIDAVETGRKTFVQGKKKFDEITHGGNNSLVVPILASGVIGAGVAWLFMTKSGKEFQGDLKRAAGTTADYMSTAVDKSKEIYQEGKAAVSGAVESGKRAFIEGTEKIRRVA